MRASLRVAVLLVCGFAASTSLRATERDPLEGRWRGTIGTPKERIDAGFELVRDAKTGALRIKLTQPMLSLYGVELPDAVERDGDSLRVPSQYLELRREGERLVGHYPGPSSPATFERVDVLPRAPAPPRVPAGPEPRWQVRLGAQVYATPAVADGIAYVGTSGGVINAVDVGTGKHVWARGLGCAMYGEIAVDGDAFYLACDDGAVHKLARKDGATLWRTVLSEPVPRVLPHPAVFEWDWHAPKPLVADGAVFVGAGDGGFHALDAGTGAKRWRFDMRARVRGGAALAGTRVVFGSTDHHVHALEREDGREAWRFDTGAVIETAPLVHEGRVLIGNRGYGLYAIDAASGELAWKQFWWGSWVESVPVAVDGTLYIGSSDLRRVSAIDAATGNVRWRSDVFGWTFGTPLVTGDVLHVGTAGGTPYFIEHRASYATLDRRTGRMLTRRELPDTGGHQWGIAGSPVLAGDVVLVATIEGSLYAFPAD